MRRRCLLLAAVATIAVGGLDAQPVMAIQGNSWGCAPDASLQLQYSPVAITDTSNVPCSTNASHWTWSSPPNGTSCTHQEEVPATTHDNGDGTTLVSWTNPVDNQPESMTVQTKNLWGDTSPPGPGQEEFLWFPFQGTWQNGTCQGVWIRSLCPKLVQINAFPLPLPACIVPDVIPGGSGMTISPPMLIDLQGKLRKQINPGSIRADPSAAGLAETASCFWLTGTTLPAEQFFQMVLIGPDDIIYTLVIDLSFTDVTWNFDDQGSGGAAAVPSECQDPSHLQLTAHTYTRISDKSPNADHTFHVTASINFGIQAFEYWRDGIGGNIAHGPVPVYAGSLSVPVPAHPFVVIQEEGIPVGA
jgi:hypothetical protein